MNSYLRLVAIALYLFFLWVGMPPNLSAEFYKYVDEEGHIFYVDKLEKVPEAYRDQIQVYREKYDNLSEADRSQVLQREREQNRQLEQAQQRQIEEQLQQMQQSGKKEKKRQAAQAKQQRAQRMQTKVIVDDNRILVPVTLTNNGIEVIAHLLLDTGASQIVLHREVADQLNLIAVKKGRAQVAGGQNIYVETGEVGSFKVGPFKMQKTTVLIISHEGQSVPYSGLLGMNFLKNVQYTIDYRNQIIRWQSPEGEASDY